MHSEPPKITLKIGIISDTHGSIHPQIVALMNRCDIAIHAGDIMDMRVLQQLKPTQKILAVVGNNDAHLTGFNEVETLDLPGGQLAIEHGHKHGAHQPCHDSLRRTYPDAKIIIYGHTHKQIIDKSHTPWVINPGAAGKIRTHGGSKCLTLTIDDCQKWQINTHIFSEDYDD